MRARRERPVTQNRKTIAYVRVSTQDQATEGVSLDAQEARIAAYAAAMGFDVSEVIRDAERAPRACNGLESRRSSRTSAPAASSESSL